ncbi:MAG: NAD(P)-binding domain-containing protein [Fulvivirga sp.]|uniref:NAD(P)-binding domain-containing protein n=1 Tax=Fulvivirga sp. TaxID=1931237 RepID=UPI0032EB9F48
MTYKAKKISIIGLGWLGKALAKLLLKDGHAVRGTVSSQQKCEHMVAEGIESSVFRLGEKVHSDLLDCDVLIYTIPPKGENYLSLLDDFIAQVPHAPQLIFISSTSVYPNLNRVVTEEDAADIPSPHTGISLLKAEGLFVKHQLTPNIIRFAGLFGGDRIPGRFLAGKQNVSGAESPVNLIHQEDCIGLIRAIINKNSKGLIINGCADSHPTKKEFYSVAAQKAGLKAPTFSNETTDYKIISNTHSKETLGYAYKHSDVIAALDLI